MRIEECKMQNDESASCLLPAFCTLHSSLCIKNGGLPRIRTVFSPVKSRDFTAKVCNPTATRRRS